MKPVIRNYREAWYLARVEGSVTSPPEHDTTRMELLAPLIKQAVELAFDLEHEIKPPSPLMRKPEFLEEMLSGNYPVDQARALCFSHLYRTVVVHSNAILQLLEDSYINAPFAVLRSVMEAFATCYHISERLETRQTICHDYIAYSSLRAMYNRRSNDAKLRQKHEMKSHSPVSLTPLKEILKENYKAFPHPHAWSDPKA